VLRNALCLKSIGVAVDFSLAGTALAKKMRFEDERK